MRIEADWIAAAGLQALFGILSGAGHQAYAVGGCVRNALLDQPVADVDVATDATPDEVTTLCEGAGLKVVPTGFEHGTVTVIADGVPYEVTTFRRDVETDGRRAVVAFSRDMAEDAARRDFTMNALYADAAGAVHDPMGGLIDLIARRVRFVGRAEDRIREDYLRALRFFRFFAWYGDPEFGIDTEALAAISANLDGLDRLSRERIGHEMRRLLAAPDPAPAVAAMQATGVLLRVLPGADPTALAPLVHLEPPLSPDWIRRLAALGRFEADDALRLSRAEARALSDLRGGIESDAGPAALAYRLGAGPAQDIVLLRAALAGQMPPERAERDIERGAKATFPVRADDLQPAFSGPELGLRLRVLEDRWIASGFTLSREQLLA